MTTPLSNTRAALSCIPLLGNIMGIYNVMDIDEKISGISDSGFLSGAIDGLSLFAAAAGALTGDQAPVLEYQTKMTQTTEKKRPYKEAGRIYTICAIVGNVLSLALAISVVALGIIPLSAGIALAVPAIAFSCVFYCKSRQYKLT